MMDHTYYRNEIEKIKDKLSLPESDSEKDTNFIQRAVVSASLLHLMPEIPLGSHDKIIKNMTFYQKWAAKDQNHVELLEHFVLEGPEPDFTQYRQEPTIFCAFHIGSYRLLIPYLVSKNIKFTLLIDANVAKLQLTDFQNVVKAAKKAYSTDDDCCTIMDTAKGSIMITMLRALKQRRCLLIFIDGNTGVDGRTGELENRIEVRLLNQTVFSRKGVAYLSYISKVSITPMITYRNPDNHWENRLRFFDSISPCDSSDRDDYAKRTLQTIYGILESMLVRVFEQWESWRYIDKSLSHSTSNAPEKLIDLSEIKPDAYLIFNIRRYVLSTVGGTQGILFDRHSYRTTLISDDFMKFLNGFVNNIQSVNQSLLHASMSKTALVKLLEKEILEFSNANN